MLRFLKNVFLGILVFAITVNILTFVVQRTSSPDLGMGIRHEASTDALKKKARERIPEILEKADIPHRSMQAEGYIVVVYHLDPQQYSQADILIRQELAQIFQESWSVIQRPEDNLKTVKLSVPARELKLLQQLRDGINQFLRLVVQGLASLLWDIAKVLVQSLWEIGKILVQALWEISKVLANLLWEIAKGLALSLWEISKVLVQFLWEIIKDVFGNEREEESAGKAIAPPPLAATGSGSKYYQEFVKGCRKTYK